MYQRSDKFDVAVRQSHKMATRCDVLVDGALERTLTINEGNVTIDDVAIRRRATINLTDPTGDLMPQTAFDLMMPGRNEFQLFRGIDYNDGTEPELLSLGIFGISDLQIEDSGQGLTMIVDGFDRARRVARARMPDDYQIFAGTPYIGAIQNLLVERYPDVIFNSAAHENIMTPAILIEQGEDPWEHAQKMAASIGCDLYFNPGGICVCEPIVMDLEDDPVDWVYAEGDEAMLLYLSKRITDEGVYSRVVVTGENTSIAAPVRGEAVDNDPLSPTYHQGPFGEVTKFFSSSFITTPQQAEAAARRELAKSVGFFERIETISIVHPAHELGDVIRISRPESHIDNLFAIDKITIPLVHSRGMNISTRTRRMELLAGDM